MLHFANFTIITSHVPLRWTNYGIRKLKIFCFYECFSVSRYIKGGRKLHKIAWSTITFLDNVCVNSPYWKGSGIIFLCQYNISGIIILYSYMGYIDRLLNVFFLFFTVILSEPHEKLRRKGWATEKSTYMNLSEGYHFLAVCPLSLVICFCFSSTPSLSSTLILCRKKIVSLQKMMQEAGAHPAPNPQYLLLSWHIKWLNWNRMNLLPILSSCKLN